MIWFKILFYFSLPAVKAYNSSKEEMDIKNSLI